MQFFLQSFVFLLLLRDGLVLDLGYLTIVAMLLCLFSLELKVLDVDLVLLYLVDESFL